MKVSRKSTKPALLPMNDEMPDAPETDMTKTNECGAIVEQSESTNTYRTETYQKDGWTITKSFYENRNYYDGKLNVNIGRSLRKEKDGNSEYLDNNYNVHEGIVTVNTNRGTSKTYQECDMTVEDWQFSMDLED